jgi:hypothetical protein
MKTLTRLRHAQKRIVRAQRRLWMLQAALWSALVLAGVSALGALAFWMRGRRTDDQPTYA